jgi:hypothetical protein
MQQKFPFNDELLKCAKVAQIKHRQLASFNHLQYFATRYPQLVEDVDALQCEFMAYRVDPEINSITGETEDEKWGNIFKMTNFNGSPKYPKLARVVLSLMSIFHSNADCERLFSQVSKNKTKFRAALSPETLGHMMVHKTAMQADGATCFSLKPSKEFLQKAKSAYYTKIQAASSSINQ